MSRGGGQDEVGATRHEVDGRMRGASGTTYGGETENGSPEGSQDAGCVRRCCARDLIGDGPWLAIEHGGAEYRLRITRRGKLILTK